MGKHSAAEPPAPIFVLAPPLGLGAHLAACLGRHPDLVSLPAIQLLCADSPAELVKRWDGKMRFVDHGLIRAVAVLIYGGETPETAQQAVAWLRAQQDVSSAGVLDALRAAAAPRRLIDPSFLYPVDGAAFQRMAALYPQARYIHFLRHPKIGFPDPVSARNRSEALWLKPHLAIHAFLLKQPANAWIRLRQEALSAAPERILAGVLDWLGLAHDAKTTQGLLDRSALPDFACRGPDPSPHGVDPELVADPALARLFEAPDGAGLDRPDWEDSWEQDGFDTETQQMARLFGYV